MRLFSLFYLLLSLLMAEDKIAGIELPNIPSKNLLSITADGSNFIWVGTDQGLVRFDGIDLDIFRSNPFSPTSLSGNRVWFLDNYNADTLIAITDNAIHLYSKKNYKFDQYKINSRPTNYYKLDNEIWITTLSDGVYKLNKNKELIRYRFEPLNPFSISSSNFESVNGNKFALDSNGNIWLATSSGLNKIKNDNSVRRYFRSNTDNALLSENILSLYFVNNGTLLIGTDKGLNYFDINNEKFSSEPQLKNKSINNIIELDGEILFFTNTNIYKQSNNSLVLYKSNNIFSNVNSDGKSNLFWEKGNSKILYNGKAFDLKKNVNDVFQLNSDFIVSTSDGLVNLSSRKLIAEKSDYRLQKKQNIDLINFYDDERYKKIKIDKFDSYAFTNSHFWFVSGGKVGRVGFENNTAENFEYNPRNPNSFPKSASVIAQHNGFLWVGSSETGLYKYASNNLSLVKHYQFDINDPNSLQTSIVTSLLVKDGKLWIGSGGDGVFIYDRSIDGFEKKDVKSGLSSDIINKLFAIDNILFASTQLGLNYLVSDDTYFKSIDSEDGLKLASYNGLSFSNINNKLIVEAVNSQYSIDISMLSKSTSASDVIVKEVIGTDSKNTEHMLSFINNEVVVPPYITSLDIIVSFPSLYKAPIAKKFPSLLKDTAFPLLS